MALAAKSNKNGTNIDHKWDQSGPGGGEGYPKINENMKNSQNAKVKNPNEKKRFRWKCGAIYSKIEGLNGLAFTVVISTTVIQMT